jgi:hypothetical protein
MNELKIPGPAVVQSVGGQGGTRDGKPHLERRRRRKKKPEDGTEAEVLAEDDAKEPAAKAPEGEEPEDEERGKHVDVRA